MRLVTTLANVQRLVCCAQCSVEELERIQLHIVQVSPVISGLMQGLMRSCICCATEDPRMISTSVTMIFFRSRIPSPLDRLAHLVLALATWTQLLKHVASHQTSLNFVLTHKATACPSQVMQQYSTRLQNRCHSLNGSCQAHSPSRSSQRTMCECT